MVFYGVKHTKFGSTELLITKKSCWVNYSWGKQIIRVHFNLSPTLAVQSSSPSVFEFTDMRWLLGLWTTEIYLRSFQNFEKYIFWPRCGRRTVLGRSNFRPFSFKIRLFHVWCPLSTPHTPFSLKQSVYAVSLAPCLNHCIFKLFLNSIRKLKKCILKSCLNLFFSHDEVNNTPILPYLTQYPILQKMQYITIKPFIFLYLMGKFSIKKWFLKKVIFC